MTFLTLFSSRLHALSHPEYLGGNRTVRVRVQHRIADRIAYCHEQYMRQMLQCDNSNSCFHFYSYGCHLSCSGLISKLLGRWPYPQILFNLLLEPQQAPQLEPQQPLQPLAPSQFPFGQWVPHGDATEAEDATEASWVHEPPQFDPHTDCEHAVPLGQLQFPPHVCPRVNPVPASSRTININAIFLKSNTHSFFLNRLTVRAPRCPCGLWLFGFRQMTL